MHSDYNVTEVNSKGTKLDLCSLVGFGSSDIENFGHASTEPVSFK
jgi:hypothetical protein